MLAILLLLRRLVRALRLGWHDAELRGLFYLVLALLLIGTLTFRLVEGWGWLDSLYFTVVTMATVGYGDLTPTSPISKIFTMLLIVTGLGVFLAFIDKMAPYIERTRRADAPTAKDE